MKTNAEITESKKIIPQRMSEDGGIGIIHINGWQGSIIWSRGGGWDHVSVAPFKHRYTPTWSDMCDIKSIFFGEDEWVVQYHPAKTEYINNMPNCLHLWRPQRAAMPVPPAIMVGIKDGQSAADVRAAIKAIE